MGLCGENEFDALILRTLLIDGEVFIRIHKEARNPYGLSFELIDAASIDFTKIREASPGVDAIVLGVEVDKHYRPTYYYIRQGNSTTYQAGKTERVSASEIIHLFRKEFPQQVRGIPPLNACLEDLKQLEDYRVAELMAAKTSACLGIFYERNSSPVAGDILNEADEEDKGEFVQSLEPGMASVAPMGYNVKSLSPTHPNNGFGEFNKAVLKQISASLGVSYSKLLKDYSDVNYSSLREGTIDENAYYAELQAFLIENWKEKEFNLFIEALALHEDSLKPNQLAAVKMHHTWICQKRALFDKSKEILAIERELKLGLKSPIMLMEEDGLDPDDVMKSWKLYEDLCGRYGVSFNVKGEPEGQASLGTEDGDFNNEAQQDEMLDAER